MFPTPTVVGDQLLIASCAGWFYSLDRHTGEQQWRFDIKPAGGRQFHGEMTVAGDRVVFGTDTTEGSAHALNLETGEELWRYPCDSALRVDLLHFENSIVGVAKRDDKVDELFCLDLTDGSTVWTVDHDRLDAKAFGNSPILIDDRVYFGSASGIAVYDVRTGEHQRTLDLGGPISTSLLQVDNHVYAGVGEELLRVDLDTGEVDGRYNFGGNLVGRPALIGDSIAMLVAWRTPNSRLVVLNRQLSSVRWEWRPEINSNYGTIARLHTYAGDLVIGTQQGRVYGLDVDTGAVTWETKVGEAVRSAGFHNGIMYVGTIPGPVYAIRMPLQGN